MLPLASLRPESRYSHSRSRSKCKRSPVTLQFAVETRCLPVEGLQRGKRFCLPPLQELLGAEGTCPLEWRKDYTRAPFPWGPSLGSRARCVKRTWRAQGATMVWPRDTNRSHCLRILLVPQETCKAMLLHYS